MPPKKQQTKINSITVPKKGGAPKSVDDADLTDEDDYTEDDGK